MKKESREALDAYFAEAGSWAEDRNDALRKSRKIAWAVAGGASIIAVCEALALMFLTPLKTVEPYTLMVDRQTGFVQALKPLDAQMVSADRALTQSFLVQYVIAREGFDITSLQSDYRKVMLWSADSARQSYSSAIQASNPESPLTKLPRSTLIDVRVKSVTSLSPNVAMVRYETTRRDDRGRGIPPQAWVSVISYGYSGEPLSVDDRMINPLGFRVSRYRKSAETLPPAETRDVAASAPAPSPAAAISDPTPSRPVWRPIATPATNPARMQQHP